MLKSQPYKLIIVQTQLDDLHGTTLRVYRFIYRQKRPAGVRDVQRSLHMASASTAHYHIEKLVKDGLIQEEGDGYVVNRVFFENFVRIRRMAVPLSATSVAFFATSLFVLLTVVRPPAITGMYLFGVLVCVTALGLETWRTAKDFRRSI
jgi:predicted DNA-binding transcriptional regulator